MRHVTLPALIALAMAGPVVPAWAGDLTAQEQRGRELYRAGVAADGTSVTAVLAHGSLRLAGTRGACASCHGSDGLGRPDAGVVPSDITWANLTKPYGLRHDNGRSHPPYTADAIIAAITAGIDPAGNTLDPAMPRYTLDEGAAQALLAYLKRLGDDSDRGVREGEIVVATLLPGNGPLDGIGRVVGRLLAAGIDRINQEGGIYSRKIVLKTATFDAADTAVDALRRLMSETAIFAVVAPLTLGPEALAEFAEREALPVVGPLAQQRSSDHQGFTFYLTAGLEDQVRALAKFAQAELALSASTIAIVAADDGSRLDIDNAFRQQNQDAAKPSAVNIHLTGSTAMADVVPQLRRAAVNIIFYDGGPTGLVALARETGPEWRPAILTTGLAVNQQALAELSEVHARIFVASPLLDTDQSRAGIDGLRALQAAYGIPARYLPTQTMALAAARILIEGLKRGGRDLTRAKFVAALAALQNVETGLVPPVSFGPNRRTGVRGAHVVALGRGQSDWKQVWISLD